MQRTCPEFMLLSVISYIYLHFFFQGDTFSRMETICQLTYQAEINISPTEQSLIDIEQDEASFPNPSNDAYFRKEINNRHIPYAQTPFEPMHTSLGSTQNPFEAGSMLTPFEPTQPSFDTLEALSGTMQSPLGAMRTSLGATYTPPQMMYPPSDTTHIPLGSIPYAQTPFEPMHTSLGSTQNPFEAGSMLTPFEPTQPSFDTLEALLGTMQSPLGAMRTSLGATYTPPQMMYPPSDTTHIPLGSIPYAQTPFEPMHTSLGSTQNPFEAGSMLTPFEPTQPSFDTLEALSGTMQSPLGAMRTSLGATYTPPQMMYPPSDTTHIPLGSIPYAQTPFEPMHTSLGSTQNPFEAGSMLTPFEPTQPSFDTLEALSGTMQSPLGAMRTSLRATYTPPQMMYPPSETTHIPLGSMQTPFGVSSPLASRKIPFESRKIPFQNTHTPSQTPFEFPKSLKRTYCESTCINPEVVLKLVNIYFAKSK
ncbi:uncharacterized protein HKW66_Vig0169010 [Vigna angularis]|uniref:Uncharacterized protein n=1 Tax=Phaseolus angularis TaxID=3914 RepID=A0A8T0JPG9_PHAAN|nr:uncharacterized protein HKW66_Vig0169000 [Vigna angularis]KAG2380122.1 uncharacterized protein HKW66_Vig0169010 [Vigna angularis]